jgi:hypothetical protein
MKPLTQSEIEDARYESDLYSNVFHGSHKTANGPLIRGFVKCLSKKQESNNNSSKGGIRR